MSLDRLSQQAAYSQASSSEPFTGIGTERVGSRIPVPTVPPPSSIPEPFREIYNCGELMNTLEGIFNDLENRLEAVSRLPLAVTNRTEPELPEVRTPVGVQLRTLYLRLESMRVRMVSVSDRLEL